MVIQGTAHTCFSVLPECRLVFPLDNTTVSLFFFSVVGDKQVAVILRLQRKSQLMHFSAFPTVTAHLFGDDCASKHK